jgi:hypothetical protein
MKRIDIRYGDTLYTIGNTDLDELKARLLAVATGDTSFWLQVNEGEGGFRPTELLITAHTPIAVSGIDAE